MPAGPRRLRPWRATGIYRGYRSGTPPAPTPSQQRSIATLREQLLADHLHNDATAGQSVILDLLTFAKIRHADAMTYLSQMPRPWIDRRAHRAWRIVDDLARMERHIARLTLALVDPVLERRPTPPMDLTSYVAQRDAEKAAQDARPTVPEGANVPEGAKDSSKGTEGAKNHEGAEGATPCHAGRDAPPGEG
jgi:hypothetical protein